MEDLNYATQGDVEQQQRASELNLRSQKEISPSLPSEVKYSVSLKNCCRKTATGPRSINPWLAHQHTRGYLAPTSQTDGIVEDPIGHSPLPTPHVNQRTGAADRKIMFGSPGYPVDVGHFYHL